MEWLMLMFNPKSDFTLVLEKLVEQLAVKSNAMIDLERNLKIAGDALTPLAQGAHISHQSQISLAAIALIAVNQAQYTLVELKGAIERPQEMQ